MKLNPLRTIKALYSLARLVDDPDRLGDVFEIADALASPKILEPIVTRLSADPRIAEAFATRHRLRVSIAELRRLPEGTLGREFAEHMVANDLDPAALPTLASPDRYEYFRAHLYETHDLWHLLTGFSTDYVGELGLQGFYLAQIPARLPALLLATGFLRVGLIDESLIPALGAELVRGYRMGAAAKPLFGVRWEELWSTPLAEVQRHFGLEPTEARGVAAAAA